jgi:hypothetical protein
MPANCQLYHHHIVYLIASHHTVSVNLKTSQERTETKTQYRNHDDDGG